MSSVTELFSEPGIHDRPTLHELWETGVDPEAIKKLLSYAELRHVLIDGRIIELRAGAIYYQPESKAFGAEIATAYGFFRLTGVEIEQPRRVDIRPVTQSAPKRSGITSISEQVSTIDPLELVRDPSTDITKKVQALSELISLGHPEVGSLIVSELKKDNVPPEWLDSLICATEYVQFRDPDHRQFLAARLYERAVSLLTSSRGQQERTLWATIRRYATLIPETEVVSLEAFLGAPASIGTRQVAMQGIQTIFEKTPPDPTLPLATLKSRIAVFCAKYFDPDILASPESASLALNAFLALAVLGDENAGRYAALLKQEGNGWMVRRATRFLEHARKSWGDRQRHAASVLDVCLDILRSRD